jgi:hypothetical protein
MIGSPPPDPTPGRELGEFLRALVLWLRRNTVKVWPGGGLRLVESGGGSFLTLEGRGGCWAKLVAATDGTGGYTFARVRETSGGGWAVEFQTFSGSTYTFSGACQEVNFTAGLAADPSSGLVVWIEPTRNSAAWRFSKGLC